MLIVLINHFFLLNRPFKIKQRGRLHNLADMAVLDPEVFVCMPASRLFFFS